MFVSGDIEWLSDAGDWLLDLVNLPCSVCVSVDASNDARIHFQASLQMSLCLNSTV